MGLDYYLKCEQCEEQTHKIEFSACGYIQVKHPDELDYDFAQWIEFLAAHSGHSIKFLDAFGKETNPKQVTGHYILGITKTIGENNNK